MAAKRVNNIIRARKLKAHFQNQVDQVVENVKKDPDLQERYLDLAEAFIHYTDLPESEMDKFWEELRYVVEMTVPLPEIKSKKKK